MSGSAIQRINNGSLQRQSNIDYPIRKNYHKKGKETTLSPDIVDEICNIILNTNLSLKEISKKRKLLDEEIKYKNQLKGALLELYAVKDKIKEAIKKECE